MEYDTIKESIANVMEAKKMLNKAQSSVLTEIKKVLPSFEGKVYEDYEGTFLIKKVIPNKCKYDTINENITFCASGWLINKYHKINNVPKTFFHTQEYPYRINLKLDFFINEDYDYNGKFVDINADEFMSQFNKCKNELKYMGDRRGNIIVAYNTIQIIKDGEIQDGTVIEYDSEKKMFKVAVLGDMIYCKGTELYKLWITTN